MPGKKRKAAIDVKAVSAYRKKLRKRAPLPLLKLTNEECKKYTIKSPFRQNFSLPLNILLYVAQNPSSPSGHLKFISTCKSLARMSRILPVQLLSDRDDDDCNKWIVDHKVSINLKDQYFKLWIYNQLCIWSNTLPNLASTLIKHGCQFSLREFDVHNQDLTFGELQILVSGAHLESVEFENNIVKNSDGSIVEFEKVLELLCCKYVDINLHPEHHGIGKNSTKKIIEMLSSEQIPVEQDIGLKNVPQNFDFSLFSEFLKANMTSRQHKFDLNFSDGISDAYKNQLQQFVDEIIQLRGIYAHTIPLIRFPGLNRGYELLKMRFQHFQGILRKPGDKVAYRICLR